jgi:hypothetical protein
MANCGFATSLGLPVFVTLLLSSCAVTPSTSPKDAVEKLDGRPVRFTIHRGPYHATPASEIETTFKQAIKPLVRRCELDDGAAEVTKTALRVQAPPLEFAYSVPERLTCRPVLSQMQAWAAELSYKVFVTPLPDRSALHVATEVTARYRDARQVAAADKAQAELEATELAARVHSNARRQEQTRIEKAREAERVARIPDFRANLRTGDRARISSRTAGGLVDVRGLAVEVKPPLALIQFPNELRWVRIDELYPEN